MISSSWSTALGSPSTSPSLTAGVITEPASSSVACSGLVDASSVATVRAAQNPPTPMHAAATVLSRAETATSRRTVTRPLWVRDRPWGGATL